MPALPARHRVVRVDDRGAPDQPDPDSRLKKSFMGHDERGNGAWFHRRHSGLGHCGEYVGGRRIDKNQAGDIAALPGGKHARVRAAEGMAGGNERAFFASSLEQCIKFVADGFGVSRRLGR
jgi:hypothetical protein